MISVASLGLAAFGRAPAGAQDPALSSYAALEDDAGVPFEPAPIPTPSGESQAAVDAEPEYGAVAISPGGAGVPLDEVPRNVQTLTADQLGTRRSVGLHDALATRLSSAVINDVQNNPLQPDFQYRGFTLSPLLGVPQGIAVYQNGVRINEPFGDLMMWDLVPTFALSSVQLHPGASPIYGLNALGGSLVLRMKDGFTAPGLRVEASGGSFARYRTSLEYGRSWGDWAVYAGVSLFDERGFRDHSRSSARNLYTDVRHQTTTTEVGASVTLGSTDLNGNGPAPAEQLARDRDAVFTWPDNTANDMWMISLDGRQKLSRRASLAGNLYLRHGERTTLNGDAAEFEVCDDAGSSVLCDEDSELVVDEAARTIATSDPFDAVFNTSQTVTDSHGAAVQLDLRERLFSRPNRFVTGVSYDGASTEFLQRVEAGFLTLDRTVQGSGVYLSGDAYRTDLHVRDHSLGVYLSDTWAVIDPLAITLAARASWFNVIMEDQAGDALDGNHTFARINPSLGATLRLVDGLSLFASYGESNRAPSASELACADPDEPCRVPNAFVADPPLEQVVSRSVELGVRGRLGEARRPWLQTTVAVFGSRNQDDIIFVSGSRVGTGYFRNAGETQRIGLELSFELERGPLTLYAGYSLLRATFEDDLELPGGAHPSLGGAEEEEGGEEEEEAAALQVDAGSRIPGLPTHSVRAGIAVRPIDALEIGLTMAGQSSQPFRGDEANLLAGPSGWVVLGAHASYRLFESLLLFVHANNLLDTEYNTWGVLGEPAEALPGTSNPRFFGVGAPFGVWAGARFTQE